MASKAVANQNNSLEGQNLADTSGGTKRANWQVSLIGGACACIIVLIINLGITIWSSVSLKANENGEDYEPGQRSSRRIMYEGSCSASRTLSVVIHLIINIFGSILLAASNHGMQCLSTPTRGDVQKAHAHKQWMDIGILTFRNLRMVSRIRVALWLLLILSSVPLHLLFNSVVYSSLTKRRYDTFSVDEEFRLLRKTSGYEPLDDPTDKEIVEQMIAGSYGQLDNLTALQCIDEYAVASQTKRDDLLVIVDSFGSVIMTGFAAPGAAPAHHAGASYLNFPVKEMCRLNFDFQIAVVILAVNFIEAIVLVFIALRPSKEPLFVLGDAIESFLVSLDEKSGGNCLASARMVQTGHFDDLITWIQSVDAEVLQSPGEDGLSAFLCTEVHYTVLVLS
ncbi:hypothetical protein FGADI_2110 [Fusarium gaditjirri]|uniref:DUF6536 domain-containing protein n=1 Tax=Fusarium gaditjirri TaxID=282569 RepID=A0A8H4TJ23_9HYPO|nr:hypothetical protein FGADI_2110 [Fusarium gaditjirri]